MSMCPQILLQMPNTNFHKTSSSVRRTCSEDTHMDQDKANSHFRNCFA